MRDFGTVSTLYGCCEVKGDKLLARAAPRTKAKWLESSPLVIVEARIDS